MAEKEKKSSTATEASGGSSIVKNEQSENRHKQPYRPTDLQDDARPLTPDLHHKRSRVFAVPSVAGEIKETLELPDSKERTECEGGKSATEKQKQIVATRSTTLKRRDSSPEAILMAQIQVEKAANTTSQTTQPTSQPQSASQTHPTTQPSAPKIQPAPQLQSIPIIQPVHKTQPTLQSQPTPQLQSTPKVPSTQVQPASQVHPAPQVQPAHKVQPTPQLQSVPKVQTVSQVHPAPQPQPTPKVQPSTKIPPTPTIPLVQPTPKMQPTPQVKPTPTEKSKTQATPKTQATLKTQPTVQQQPITQLRATAQTSQPITSQPPLPTKTTQPIPMQPAASTDLTEVEKIEAERKEKKGDEDSITEEIAELRPDQTTKKEWEIDLCGQEYVAENRVLQDPLQRKCASEIITDNVDVTDVTGCEVTFQETDEIVSLQRKPGSEIINEVITCTHKLKKKEITWNDSSYLDKVPLQQNLRTQSFSGMLERKASVGPCFRKTTPFGEPSGITICLPKKSSKCMNENINPNKSGICITVSKRCFDTKQNSSEDSELKTAGAQRNVNGVELRLEEGHCTNLLINLRERIDTFCVKIKHALHM